MNKLKSIETYSYSPYSHQEEGCFILGASGVSYPGVRIENSSFPLTITAIQAALCSCLGNKDQPVGVYNTGSKSQLNNFWENKFKLKVLTDRSDITTIYSPFIPQPTDMFKALEHLCKQSVTPNSSFPVSAVLETDKGSIPGVNIEFPEWQTGLCAERVAISRAISYGIHSFKSMYIHTPKGDYCSPCGACRQVLYEFMPKGIVFLYHRKFETTRHYVKHLLPNAFVAASLNKNLKK